MAEYDAYQNQGTYSRYSQHSAAPSAQSWMPPPTQRISSVPPPQPVNLPTPVQAVRPLPVPGNASNRASAHSSVAPLQIVKKVPPPTAQYDHLLQRTVQESESGTVTSGTHKPRRMWSVSSSGGRPRPQRKKSFVGGFFKGVKKLPRAMFGYGAGMGMSGKNQLKYGDTSMTEGTSASETTGLPAYSSQPSSPVVRTPGPRSGPGPSHLNQYYGATELTIPETTSVPDVVRMDSDQRYSNIPSVRITPPSGENANLYGDEIDYPDYPDNASPDPAANNPGERTTYMVYNDRNSYYDHNLTAPTSLPRQTSISPALSYVDSQHPTSQHSSTVASTVRDVRPPNDVAQSLAPEAGARLSYAAPTASYPIPMGALQLSSAPTAQSVPQSQITPQSQIVQATNTDVPAPHDIGSPQSVHPEPAIDYRKMTLSPSPTSHDTYTSATSYYDPSFSSLNRVEKFFKMLYHMPWVSHDRVTVDYTPGDGASKGRKRKRPMSSWYHGMLRNSRSRSTLDLLSSGSPSVASPRTTSLRASLAMALGSPGSHRSGQHKSSSERHKSRHHRSHHHQSSSHHRHRRHDSRRKKRDTTTSMGTATTGTNHNAKKPTSSPLIPSVYPLQYSPYPYPAFSTFPMPAPPPVAGQPSQSGGHKSTSPHGPRGVQQQPMMYAAPTYSPYQPMMQMGAPQVFLLQPTSPGQSTTPANVPSSLVPGVGHDSHAHAQAAQLPDHQAGDHGQRQPPPGIPGGQNIPGSF